MIILFEVVAPFFFYLNIGVAYYRIQNTVASTYLLYGWSIEYILSVTLRRSKTQKLSIHEQQALVSRVEPFLKGGLSIRKACLASGVSRATLYRIMENDNGVRDQINRFQDFLSLLTMIVVSRQLFGIKVKQDLNQKLEWTDLKFVMWFATHSRHCSEEFGREPKGNSSYLSIDPNVDRRNLMKLIEEGQATSS